MSEVPPAVEWIECVACSGTGGYFGDSGIECFVCDGRGQVIDDSHLSVLDPHVLDVHILSEHPITPLARVMVVCPTCGNKRCPHATDHRLPCTGSNEPGQPGSRYTTPTETPTDAQ